MDSNSEQKNTAEASSPHGKYFGTDGFRGEANVTLTSPMAYRVGRFLGWYCKKKNPKSRARIVIGKDTRKSSYMLEYALAAGILASGADAYMLHVTTTPSVSFVTAEDGFDAGIMISASHNPFYDNGIKVVNAKGEKLSDEVTDLIEDYIDGKLDALGITGELPLAKKEEIGTIHEYISGRNRYIGHLISLSSSSYKKLKIGLDCANGAAWRIANAVFSALGARTFVIGNAPDGLNVNAACGSTHTEALSRLVLENHLDAGFAFDGDGDRCIAVDEKGKVVDGDGIMYVLARSLKERGELSKNTVAVTVMSNSGLVKSLLDEGIKCEETDVGDRFVYECMQRNGIALGGEKSGHIILRKYAVTGDGILTAIMLSEELCKTKMPLSRLSESLVLYPQLLRNVRVKDKKAVLKDESVLRAREEIERLIDKKGRVLLRASGTEPVIRIMVEAECEELCEKYAEIIEKAIIDGGYAQ